MLVLVLSLLFKNVLGTVRGHGPALRVTFMLRSHLQAGKLSESSCLLTGWSQTCPHGFPGLLSVHAGLQALPRVPACPEINNPWAMTVTGPVSPFVPGEGTADLLLFKLFQVLL